MVLRLLQFLLEVSILKWLMKPKDPSMMLSVLLDHL